MFMSWSDRVSFRLLFFDAMMFSIPIVTLTQRATKLCVAKLQAKQENSNL